jgi:hypothetical protein
VAVFLPEERRARLAGILAEAGRTRPVTWLSLDPLVHPVLVGGGIPFFPQRERRVDLELAETRTFSSRVVYLRYRVAR